MNYARLSMAAVVAWVVSIPIGFLVNNVLFVGLIASNAAALRPEAALMSKLPYGLVVLLAGFFAFAYIYAKGYEGRNGVAEGVRCGLALGVLVLGFGIVWQYVIFPITWQLAAGLMVDTIVELAIYGAIIGAIYKPAASPAAAAV